VTVCNSYLRYSFSLPGSVRLNAELDQTGSTS
jgi:hypothetical protein